MKLRNPRFGARRIAMQISNAFGIPLNKDTVLRILTKHYRAPSGNNGPSWLTFIGHLKDSLWSIDFFRAESIILKTHWVMLIMDQFARRIIGFAVHCGDLNGITIRCMFNKIIADKQLPTYLSSDHVLYFDFINGKLIYVSLKLKKLKLFL